MISRRTGWLIWGSFLVPISLFIALRSFEQDLSHLGNRPSPSQEDRLWHTLVFTGFLPGMACLLFLPFSLIRDFSRKKRQCGH